MSESQTATRMPPVEDVLGEVVATLTLAAHSYLEPSQGVEVDVEAAEIAIDAAGAAFERVRSRLRPEQHTLLSGLLTSVRMSVVRKRGA